MEKNNKRIVFAFSTNGKTNYEIEALYLRALEPVSPTEDERITQARIDLHAYAQAILSCGENYLAIVPADLEKAIQKLLRSKRVA